MTPSVAVPVTTLPRKASCETPDPDCVPDALDSCCCACVTAPVLRPWFALDAPGPAGPVPPPGAWASAGALNNPSRQPPTTASDARVLTVSLRPMPCMLPVFQKSFESCEISVVPSYNVAKQLKVRNFTQGFDAWNGSECSKKEVHESE
jgi:hypothetical protein